MTIHFQKYKSIIECDGCGGEHKSIGASWDDVMNQARSLY